MTSTYIWEIVGDGYLRLDSLGIVGEKLVLNTAGHRIVLEYILLFTLN